MILLLQILWLCFFEHFAHVLSAIDLKQILQLNALVHEGDPLFIALIEGLLFLLLFHHTDLRVPNCQTLVCIIQLLF